MSETKTVAKEIPKPFTRHRCKRCGHIWQSRPYRFKDDREEPFKCPKCGSRYWWM